MLFGYILFLGSLNPPSLGRTLYLALVIRELSNLLFLFSNRKYVQALEYHRQALVLIPQHASTYSVIGYVHSLMGDFESAIDYFHTVLVIQFLSLYLNIKSIDMIM